jgi:hypothetical protein
MTDADMFMGRSAPCSSSGMGAFLGTLELSRIGRWLSVLDAGFWVGELCGELIGGDEGFIVIWEMPNNRRIRKI